MRNISLETLEARRAWVGTNKRGSPIAIEGSPDLIVEVVSKSSAIKDKTRWRTAYHRAGVREYWIIDGRETEIRVEILKWTKKAYASVAV